MIGGMANERAKVGLGDMKRASELMTDRDLQRESKAELGCRIRRGGWVQTFTGRRAWPREPDAGVVCLEDVVHSLSLRCRFGGHCRLFYSVAEHCVRGMALVSEGARLEFLLHDAAEAYLADVPRPLKRAPEMRWYRVLERGWEEAIASALGVRREHAGEVRLADMVMLATERRDLMGPVLDGEDWGPLPEPSPQVIIERTWRPEEAEERFLARFELETSRVERARHHRWHG